MPPSPTDIITKNPKIAARLFDERMLVITATDSMLHRLNEVGTFIWSLLDDKMAIREICKAVQEHFQGVDSTKITSEISVFIETLHKKNLILISQAE